MKRHLLHLLLVMVTLTLGNTWIAKAQAPTGGKGNKLRFSGFYCEQLTVEGRTCLRFYNDGLVLSVSLGDMVRDKDLIDVAKWFRRDPEKKNKGISEGLYLIKGRRISFTNTVVYVEAQSRREVKVDYKGIIRSFGKTLILDSYSHYNGNRESRRRFVFMKIKSKFLSPKS